MRVASLTGSSPRARGTRNCQSAKRAERRFIPACAGNATPCSAMPDTSTVHPRVRGERDMPVIVLVLGAGSSPRARGTRFVRPHGLVHVRFIPACAGNACRQSW